MKPAIPRIPALMLVTLAVFSVSCGHRGRPASPQEQTPGFYIDASNGNDSNAGTGPSVPWRSLGKISAVSVPGGSSIYLNRGSVWYEQLIIPASAITIDAYGPGTGPLPKIDGSRPVTGWTGLGGGLYSTSVVLGTGEALGNLSENGVMMKFLEWNIDAVTTFAAAGPGSYSYEYPSTLYIKSGSLPAGNEYRASVKIYGISAVSRSDITVKNIEITRFSLHGVHFQDCARFGVFESIISNGGGAVIMVSPLLYAGNGIEFDNSSTNGIAEAVEVSGIFDSGISPQTWLAGQAMSSIAIRNSQVSTCGFAGIEVSVLSNGGTTGSSIAGIVISGMTIVDSGRGWSGRRYGTEGHGIRIKADNGAGSMTGVQIDTTKISGSIGDGVSLAGDIGAVILNRLNVTDNACGISLQEPSAAGLKLSLTSSLVHHNTGYGILYNSPTAAGFEIYQNTLSDNSGINLAVFSHSGIAKIQNNIFFGSSPMTHLYAGSVFTGAVIDNNCYNNQANMFGYGPDAYSSVAAFTGATGFESAGIGGTVGFTDPVNGNFMLTDVSQCKSLGSPSAGVVLDYSGYPFSLPPSSGAYQYR